MASSGTMTYLDEHPAADQLIAYRGAIRAKPILDVSAGEQTAQRLLAHRYRSILKGSEPSHRRVLDDEVAYAALRSHATRREDLALRQKLRAQGARSLLQRVLSGDGQEIQQR